MKTKSLITFVLLQCITITGFAQTVNIDKAFVSSEGSALYVAPVPVTPPGYTIQEFGGVYESYPVNESTLYTDLQQASYFGYDPDYWYSCQVGCWVYAENSFSGNADLKFTISHRWASSVSGLASASWSTVMYSSPRFDTDFTPDTFPDCSCTHPDRSPWFDRNTNPKAETSGSQRQRSG